MSIPKFNPRSVVLLVIILAVGALRVITSFSSSFDKMALFSPLGAMALFGGAYFSDSKKAFGLPLLTLLVGDLILSATIFKGLKSGLLYVGWYWTYTAFALMTLTGKLFIKEVKFKTVILASLICVLIHWIVSDIGAWQMGVLYPKTFAGYLECLVGAIPYEGRFLAGTLVYSGIFFGLFEWMQKRYAALRLA